MKKITIALLATSLIFLGGCIKKTDSSPAIIKVNGRVITQKTYDKTFEQVYNSSMFKQNGVDVNAPHNRFIYLVHKNNVVNNLILNELVKYEAEKRQLKVTEDEVNSSLEEIISNLGGQEKFENALSLSKIKEDAFRKNLKLDLLKKKLVQSIMKNKEITEEEAQKFYDENKDKHFKRPDQVKASHILISASESDIKNTIKSENTEELKEDELNKKVQEKLKEARKRANDLHNQLAKDPEKFVELAKTHSEDPSTAEKGGDLGFFSKEEMVPEFSEAAFSTKPGKISDVVKTGFGYHIIKVFDRKEAGTVPFDEVKDNIKKYISSKKEMEAFKNLMEASKMSADIVYLDEKYDPEHIQQELKKLNEAKTESRVPKAPKAPPKPE